MASPFEWKAVEKFDTYTNDLLKFVERIFRKLKKYLWLRREDGKKLEHRGWCLKKEADNFMANPFEWKAVEKFDTYTNDLLKFVERIFRKLKKYLWLRREDGKKLKHRADHDEPYYGGDHQ